MLTYPSDSLPHIVCPMEEDAIPPNPFCNAPPHSEPPPPLLPLPSITPSCEDDGKSGQRHSGHVQAVKDQPSTKPSHEESGAAQRPSGRIPSPAEREGKSATVRVPLSPSVKLLRLDTRCKQRAKQNKNALDFEDASDCLTKHNNLGSTAGEGRLSAAENVDKQFAGNTALDLDVCQSETPRSDMDKFGELAVENQSAPTGWVIGPLIQSFKSKMASFTQIVMSPVKLFKANSPPQSSDREDELNQCDQNDVRATFEVQGQGDNGNKDDEAVSEEESISASAFSLRQRGLDDQPSLSSAQNGLPDARHGINLETASPEHPRTSLFDADLLEHTSVQAGECSLNEKAANANDSLPLRRSPSRHKTFEDNSQSSKSFLRSSLSTDDAGASRGSKLKVSGDVEVWKGKTSARPKPRPRKPAGNRSVLQRGSSKTHASEVNEEGPVHGLNGEQFYHLHTMETNISDSGDNGNTLPTSVCYVPPDTFCPPHDDDDDESLDGNKKDVSVRKSLRNTSKGAAGNERALKVVLDALPVQKRTDEPDITSDSVADSAVKVGKAKRRLKLSSQMDIEADLAKSKRLRADKCTEDAKHKGVLTTASDNGMLGGLKRPRNNVVSRNTLADVEVMLNPAAAEPPVSKGLKRKAKAGQKSLDTVNETVLNTKTGNPSGAVTVSSLDCGNGVSENSQKAANRRKDTSGSIKGLKKTTKFTLTNPDKNVVDEMDLETTMTTTAMTTTLITGDQEKLSEVFAQPLDAKLCRPQMADGKTVKYVRRKREVLPVLKVETSQSKSTELTRKPIKRKSRKQDGLTSEEGSALVPTSSATLTLEFTPADLDASRLLRGEESSKTGARQPCKKPKKDCSRSVKSSVSGGSPVEEIAVVNDSQSQRKEATISAESLSALSKMTPAEDNLKPVPSPSQPYPEISVRLVDVVGTSRGCGKDEMFPAEAAKQSQNTAMDEVEMGHKEEESCTYKVSQLRQSARRVKTKPRRAENQRRMSRVLRSRTHQDEEKEEGEKQMNAVTSEETDLARAGTRSLENTGFSKRLLRSHSCPDIPSFLPRELPPTSPLYSPQHGRSHASPHGLLAHTPSAPHAHKWSRRARRHTVCSVEVEREIAPLCLRKEVYPSRRTTSCRGLASHLSPGVPLSPSMSLSVLASCFLSSPLAFLSKKPENRGAATSGVGTSSHVFSPSPSPSSSSSGFTSSTSPSSSSVWRLFPGFRQRIDSSAAAVSSACSALSQIPLECDIETRQQSEEEEEEDGEDTSCSSQEFEDGGLREEKALSDSEIKVVKKHEERGKVSSIRIRKTLPKPQNNLTPMGLPRPIRLKKKEFSLEEIYTNKNFTKPPESRLETIFELPLSRRNGSECLFGQKRVKRVVEFPEVGVARKPKKPLVGAGKAGNTSSLGRPRRGGYHNAKDEPAVSVQELDSLLCAKLDQLDLWLTFDQKDS
ncbi:uncharacterized protein prr14 [Polymixia lowei]